MNFLEWPAETCNPEIHGFNWSHAASNICLDFHGDPANAGLVVFSDGNHHMALRDCLDMFVQQHNGLPEIFYTTTPPGPIVKMLRNKALTMGNLVISASPDVFISPPEVMDRLVADGLMSEHFPFVQNQGNVLIIKKGNPKNIVSLSDLVRDDVRLFLSNPDTEKISFTSYYNTLKNLVPSQDPNSCFPDQKAAKGQVLIGKCIHHREAPQAVFDGSADAAMVFYHLGLRYLRIFPDSFEVIPIGGSIENPQPVPGNVIGRTSMGLVGDGGDWGNKLISFLASPQSSAIYRYHGLCNVSPSQQ